jgi:hypothetical protein
MAVILTFLSNYTKHLSPETTEAIDMKICIWIIGDIDCNVDGQHFISLSTIQFLSFGMTGTFNVNLLIFGLSPM